MSPFHIFSGLRIRPLVRTFTPGILLPAGLMLLWGASACTTAAPKEDPLDAGARTQMLRQEAAKAEAQRIERLKLQEAPAEAQGQPQAAGSPVAGSQGSKDTSAKPRAEESKPKTKLEKAKELATKVEKAVRDLYLAELEQELAKEKTQHAELASKDKLAKATVELERAEQELVRYRRADGPALLGKQKLSLDKLIFRMEEASQNLEQMREEYGKFETDSVAQRTGEIVIWRAETQLAFAKRGVGLAKLAENTLTRTTIPQKTAALTTAVTEKKNALRQAQEGLSRLDFENKLSLTKAANNVVYKQLSLDQLREEQAGL